MIEEDVNIRFYGIRLSLVLGLVMIVAGGYNLYVYLPLELAGIAHYTNLVAYLVLTLFGLALSLVKDMNESRAVYLSGLAIGLATVFINIRPFPDFLLVFFDFLIGIVMVLMALANLFGYRYNVTRSVYIALLLIAMNLFPMVNDYFAYISVQEIVNTYYYTFPMLALYVVYVLVLTRKGIWYPSATSRVSENLHTIEDTMHTGGQEFIEPSDLAVFMDSDRSGWNHFDRGPIECETRIHLWGPSRDIHLLIQKWRDDENLLVTVLPKGHGQFTQGFQFRIVSTVLSEEGDMISFYDDAGTFVRMRVHEGVGNSGFRRIIQSVRP